MVVGKGRGRRILIFADESQVVVEDIQLLVPDPVTTPQVGLPQEISFEEPFAEPLAIPAPPPSGEIVRIQVRPVVSGLASQVHVLDFHLTMPDDPAIMAAALFFLNDDDD